VLHKRRNDERLREWIEFANLLIPQADMGRPSDLSADDPVLHALQNQFRKRFVPRRPMTESEKEETRERLNAAFARLYPGPRNRPRLRVVVETELKRIEMRGWGEFISFFTWDGSDPPGSGPHAPEPPALYRLFYSVRQCLSRLAEVGEEVKGSRQPAHLSLAMPPTRELIVGADGKLLAVFPGFVFGLDPFYEQFIPLLLSADIDILRVRICEVCRRFFYGKRRDQLGCSRAHRDVIRARRFRQKHAQYERNRKLNLAAKAARRAARLARSGKLNKLTDQ
jgi:hypothetical protein